MIFDQLIQHRATGDMASTYKWKVSGTISYESGDSPINKRLVLLDRRTFEIIGTGWAYADGTFLVKCRYQPDETVMLIGMDEGGNYNADVYDRLSLCSDELSLPEGSTWRPIKWQGRKIWTSANFATDGVLTHLAVNASATGLETSGANVGTWVSSAILLTKYNADALYNNRLQYAKLGWCYPIGSPSVDYSTVYKGYVSLDGGTTWTQHTENGGEIAGLDDTTDLDGVSIQTKMEVSDLSGTITPRLIGVCLEIY
mgnify:CR=1 FL=1